mmetsp:Transcript_71904/g.204012  ORF Transcript_71904/g.204012 Transcript_71904/m.204012 type:complete len:377 (+) Transcript_71904:348-1478(+)
MPLGQCRRSSPRTTRQEPRRRCPVTRNAPIALTLSSIRPGQAVRITMCIPCSVSTRSLSCPTCSAKAASSKAWPYLPGFTQLRSPTKSPAFRQLGHSESSLQRVVKARLSGSPSHSSRTARRVRSASPRVRLTCLFLTLSMVLLHSRCFRRMCRSRTCEGSSFLAFFCGGASAASTRSKKTTMEPNPRSPTCPSHCTAASTRAPDAMRGRPALRLKTVDTATLLPMALYKARQMKAKPWCLCCSFKTLTSGVASSFGTLSDLLKSRSPKARVQGIGGGGPPGTTLASHPASWSSSSSSSSSGSFTAWAFTSSIASPLRMQRTHPTSPNVAITSREPVMSATVAQQPSVAEGCRSANSASSSSKLSLMDTSSRSSSQ